jgi:hypothetical protein
VSPVGQSRTWTARSTAPVACAYRAVQQRAAREAGESSSPRTISLPPMIITAPTSINAASRVRLNSHRVRHILLMDPMTEGTERCHRPRVKSLGRYWLGALHARAVLAVVHPGQCEVEPPPRRRGPRRREPSHFLHLPVSGRLSARRPRRSFDREEGSAPPRAAIARWAAALCGGMNRLAEVVERRHEENSLQKDSRTAGGSTDPCQSPRLEFAGPWGG